MGKRGVAIRGVVTRAVTGELSLVAGRLRAMNELLERESPDTLVECPVCAGPALVRREVREVRCEGCGVTVAIAPDGPAVRPRVAVPLRLEPRRRQAAPVLATR